MNNAVIIVGAAPAGLATAASLRRLDIPYTILERENCYASLWKKYSYDRLHLHLEKHSCELPYKPFPPSYPTYVPKKQFIEYLNDYVAHFEISPICHRNVECATLDQVAKQWVVKAVNVGGGGGGEEVVEEYFGRWLVVATGETASTYTPEIEGLSSFSGDVLHSTRYKCGEELKNKNVLVVLA